MTEFEKLTRDEPATFTFVLLPWFALLLTILGCLVLYWPALHGPWLLDDVKLQDLISRYSSSGTENLSWNDFIFGEGGGTGRPLSMFTFVVNALVSADVFGFKLVNLLLHFSVGTLIFLFLRKLLRDHYRQRLAEITAVAVTAVWLLHPLHVSTVAYVIQRMTILSALFTVGALLIYFQWRKDETDANHHRSLRRPLMALVLLPTLAVLSKETGILVVAFFLLCEALFFRFRGTDARRFLIGYHSLSIVLGISAILWMFLSGYVASAYLHRPFSLEERLLTEGRVLVGYLHVLLLPRLSDLPFYYDGLTHSTDLTNPPSTMISAAFLAAVLVSAILLRSRRPVFSFGMLFFFAGHLLESSFLPLELAFEHRNYLPSVGIFLAASDLIVLGTQNHLKKWRPFIAIGTIVICTTLTLMRANVWSSAETIYRAALSGPMPSQRAAAELAQVALSAHRFMEAKRILERFDSVGSRLQSAYIDCVATGRIRDADLRSTLSKLGNYLGDYDVSALINVSNLYLDKRCSMDGQALRTLIEKAAGVPRIQTTSRQKLWMYVGHLRYQQGDVSGAQDALEHAFSVLPQNPVPLLLAANWQLDAGSPTAACSLYKKAIRIEPPSHFQIDRLVGELVSRIRSVVPACIESGQD